MTTAGKNKFITTMKTTLASLGALAVAATVAFAQEPPNELPAGPGKRPSAGQLFKKLDANGDGVLSLGEFQASPLGQRDAAKAGEIYHKMDAQADGKVTFEEFKAFRPAWNPEQAFKKHDTDGDGVLSLDEFKAGPMAQENPAKAGEIFHKMDANSDGKVTLEEFKDFRHAWNPEEIFKKHDSNSDGSLSLDEFKGGPLAQRNPAKAEEIFHKMDANSDSKVTLKEFKAFRPQRGNRPGKEPAPAPPATPVR